MLTWILEVNLDVWHTRVATEDFNFHKHADPQLSIPVHQGHEYNITEYRETKHRETQYNGTLSTKNVTIINVTLWLLINDNVLSHVPYIFCKAFSERRDIHGSTMVHKSRKVFFELEMESNSTNDQVSKVTFMKPSNDSVSSIYTTSSAESVVHLYYSLTIFLVWGALHGLHTMTFA